QGDVVDIAGETHMSTVGGDIDVLGDVGAVEIEPVDAVLAVDGVVGVTLIPFEDVIACAEKSDVVAEPAVDEIVTAATVEDVIARKTEQGVCVVIASQNVALIASEHLLDAAQDVARGVTSTAETGRQIDADAERGREIAHGVDAEASGDDIGAGTASNQVVSVTADQRVISAAACEGHAGRIMR